MRWSTGLSLAAGLALLVSCAPAAPASTPTSGAVGATAGVAPTETAVATVAPTSTAALTATPEPTATVAASAGTISIGATPLPSPTARVQRPAVAASTPTRAGAVAPSRLFLEVVEPGEETVEVPATTASVTVAGRTARGAVVSVNGELVTPDESGAFSTQMPLEDEITVVEVVASDASGAELRAERVVVRE